MPFFLVTVGLLMIVTGVRGTQGAFAAQIKSDFVNSGTCNPLKKSFQGCGFLWWLAAIGAVGMVGYSERARPLSTAFMSLVIISMLLANKGFFTQFQAALQSGPVPPPAGNDPCGNASGGASNGTAGDVTGHGTITVTPLGDLGKTVSALGTGAASLSSIFT